MSDEFSNADCRAASRLHNHGEFSFISSNRHNKHVLVFLGATPKTSATVFEQRTRKARLCLVIHEQPMETRNRRALQLLEPNGKDFCLLDQQSNVPRGGRPFHKELVVRLHEAEITTFITVVDVHEGDAEARVQSLRRLAWEHAKYERMGGIRDRFLINGDEAPFEMVRRCGDGEMEVKRGHYTGNER